MYSEKNPLPQASPEMLGIDSRAILKFLKELEAHGHNMHGFILMRHGMIAAEGYYAPFRRDMLHRMYSVSKSFVSVAIGMLQDEGKLAIHDKIAPYFPDKCSGGDPANLHPYVADATIRDLLMMATPFHTVSYSVLSNPEHDWVKTFFHMRPNHRAGQIFYYDTAGTTVLCALVERLSGLSLLDYLRSKGFAEMGFSRDATCVKTPDGKNSWGGSGILCTVRDLAKFAEMCLHYGNFQGKQLVSESYMREATAKQIENGEYGYGYQFWRKQYGFCCYGMGGQMVYFLPELDLALNTVGDMQGQNGYIPWMEQLFYEIVLPTVGEIREENHEAFAELTEYCEHLEIQTVAGAKTSPMTELIAGRSYRMEQAPEDIPLSLRLTRLCVELDPEREEGILHFDDAAGERSLGFGLGHFVHQDFPRFASRRSMLAQGNLIYGFDRENVKTHMPCITSAAWKSDHELQITCYAIGYYCGTLDIMLSFDEDTVTAFMQPYAERFWMDLSGFQTGTLI